MTKKKTKSEATTVRELPMTFHRISALLHTMRAIDRCEEPLCTLMCDIRSAGLVTEEVRQELSGLLDDIPSHDFLVDLHSLGIAIGRAPFVAIPTQKKARKRDKGKKKVRKVGKSDKASRKKTKKLQKKKNKIR